MATMYKYNCRKCPIRNRCIDESHNSTSVKNMLRHAFEARTDTLKTWGRLQKDCLLIKAEEERAERAGEESLLSRRLREARKTKELSEESSSQKPEYLQPVKSSKTTGSSKLKRLSPSGRLKSQTKPKLKPLPPKSKPLPPPPDEPVWMVPASSEKASSDVNLFPKYTAYAEEEESPAAQKTDTIRPHWFTVGGSGRHVMLPNDGELVLGRFDPHIGIPPDIDLSFEDKNNTVSRRHAKIVGRDGYHTVEDLGSPVGVLVNGVAVSGGTRHRLETSDRIKLGKIELLYDAVPTHILIISPEDKVQHIITVTASGSQFEITPPDDIIIGRRDAFVNFVPDIDLSEEGEVSARVSRRHTIITWRNNMPYVEDSGSGFGTRINGKTLLMGQSMALKPGDHLWLGGCVLAYDVKL